MSDDALVAEGLVAEGLGLVIGSTPLLDGIDLVALPGRILAITGSSGSGKTTLLSVLGGLLAPTRGTLTRAGSAIRTDGPSAGTGFVLQVYGLVPSLTAEENISIALRARAVSPAQAVERSASALRRVGIADLADRLVQELSGGQLQRVAVARALAVEADLLIADEPTSELDEANRDLVVAELRAEADRGAIVLLATHDPEVAALCDDALRLDDGRAVQEAATVPTALDGPGHEYDEFQRPRGQGR